MPDFSTKLEFASDIPENPSCRKNIIPFKMLNELKQNSESILFLDEYWLVLTRNEMLSKLKS